MVWWIAGGAVAMSGLAGVLAARAWLQRAKATHGRRRALWERLYGLDWGSVSTNNYGFSPAEGDGPERHQFQMYAEHLKALRASGRLTGHTRLLEVSCGRGGGLAHLVARWPGTVEAVGLDLSENALAACRTTHGHFDNLGFKRGSALALPFPDGSFDVVLNVEASNDYGDYAGFFAEVARVLRPGGTFLYCDSRKAEMAGEVARMLGEAGLAGEFRDITDNVLAACRADSARRERLIRSQAPWFYRLLFGRELRSYAAVVGSAKFKAFESRRRIYVMTCAVRVEAVESAAA
jgi:ubiquinone/menaquinone biosynthesis C-methylase UbiE